MSYEKTVWANGDIITAAKLNNMENGIEAASEAASAGGIMDLHITIEEDVYTIPKSEIDAIIAGVPYAVRIYNNTSLSVIAFFGGYLGSANMTCYFSFVPEESVSLEPQIMAGEVVLVGGNPYTLDGDVYKFVLD